MPASIILHNKGEIPDTSVRRDGMVMVHTPSIKSVGVFDITQVSDHRISEVMGTVSHAVYFRNGGHLFYSYGVDGSGPIELQGNGIDLHHVGNGTIIVMPTLDLVPEGEGWQPFPKPSAS